MQTIASTPANGDLESVITVPETRLLGDASTGLACPAVFGCVPQDHQRLPAQSLASRAEERGVRTSITSSITTPLLEA